MNGTVYQLTLRRWAQVLRNPNFYISFIVVVVCCGLVGPFGTYEAMPLTQRLGLWAILQGVCWTIGFFTIVPLRFALENKGFSKASAFFTACTLSNLLIGPVFISILSMQRGPGYSAPAAVWDIIMAAPIVAAIAYVAIAATDLQVFVRRVDEAKIADDAQSAMEPAQLSECPVQERLPVNKRGTLLAMVAQDHYVEVITNKGSELLLMRLSDAVDLCKSLHSLRIHRSAWVSSEGVASVKRERRSTKVVLPGGRELPVARSVERDLGSFLGRLGIEPESSAA